MARILKSLQMAKLKPKTDDQYRENVSGKVTTLLNDLLQSLPDEFLHATTINILVIGSGFFPSFLPLVNELRDKIPCLSRIHFSLIEPLKPETDRFSRYFWKLDRIDKDLEISYTTHNTDIMSFLTNNNGDLYDIIYFEQPDLSPIGILFAHNSHQQALLTRSLRESIPYLKNIIRPQSIIVASCIYRRDLTQLNALIHFSLKIRTRLAFLPGFYNDGSLYSSGLIGVVDQRLLNNKPPESISAAIKKKDKYYLYILTLSLILFLITPSLGKIPSILLTMPIAYYHRYNYHCLLNKVALLSLQLIILIFFCSFT